MAGVKLTEKALASSVKSGAYFIISQNETVNDQTVESLRRASISQVCAAIPKASTTSDGMMTSIDYKRLDNIAELLKGHEYNVQTGTSPAYAQTVPTGAQRWAELAMVGGHTEVVTGSLVSAKVTGVKNEGKNILDLTTALMTQKKTDGTAISPAIYSVSGNTLTCARSQVSFGRAFFVIQNLEQGSYVLSFNVGIPQQTAFSVRDMTNSTDIVAATYYSASGAKSLSFTVSNTCDVGISMMSASNDYVSTFYVDGIQLERGSTATAYAPYRAPITYPVPAAVQALTGYGWSAGSVYNYIDYSRKVFVQKVGALDLSTLTWTLTNNRYWRANFRLALGRGNSYAANGISDLYTVTTANAVNSDVAWRIGIANDTASSVQQSTGINAHNGSTVTTPTGTLYYELATSVETDISAYLSGDNYIDTEAGGSVTFVQQGGTTLAVPNQVDYMVRLTDAI